MKFTYVTAVILLAAMAVSGCSMREVKKNYDDTRNWVFDTKPTAQPSHIEDDTPIMELNYEAADELDDNLFLDFDKVSPIWFSNFTNISDPMDNTPFARVVTEQVVAGLIDADLNLVAGEPNPAAHPSPAVIKARKEAAKRAREKAIKAEQAMEQAAAQTDEEAAAPAPQQDPAPVEPAEPMLPYLPSMLTGSYFIGDDVIYLSARITTLENQRVLAAHQWTLPINQNTRMLLPELMSPHRSMTPTVKTRF